MNTGVIQKPTGWRNPAYKNEIEVRILGFTFGLHRDANGYDRPAECALAICADPLGQVDAYPLRWLRVNPPEN